MRQIRSLSWNITIPLVTNSFIVFQTTVLCLITWVVISLLLGFILFMQGEASAIPQLLIMFEVIIAGLWVLMMLVMLIIFGNKMPMRFAIDKKGLTAQMISPIGKKANRLVVVLGLLLRKSAAVGSSMIAMSQETVTYPWKSIAKVEYNRQKQQIILSNSWRPLVAVYCLPNNYSQVENLVKSCCVLKSGVRTKGKKGL